MTNPKQELVLRRGYGAREFDAGVAELRRWAEEYAPQAEVAHRRHGPAWVGDLLTVLLTSVAVLLMALIDAAFR